MEKPVQLTRYFLDEIANVCADDADAVGFCHGEDGTRVVVSVRRHSAKRKAGGELMMLTVEYHQTARPIPQMNPK